ncbi:hypothetical protein ACHAQA_001318 [Verticillium albo-atrum]
MGYTLEQRQQMLQALLGPKITFISGDISPAPAKDPEFIDLDYVDQHMAFDHDKANSRTPYVPALPSGPRLYTPPTASDPNKAMAQQLQAEDFAQFQGLKLGDVSACGITFMPWELAGAYPNIFYVYNPRNLKATPKLFVPTVQFENFLCVVNASVGIRLTIPPGTPGHKFILEFGEGGGPRPRYLGRSSSGTEFNIIRGAIPIPDEVDIGKGTAEAVINDLVRKLDVLNLAKKEVKKEKSAKRREEAKTRRSDGIKSVQRMLGLRPVAGLGARSVSVDEPIPHNCDQDVVFAAVDIEVAEESHGTVLEVGISILDTRDLVDTAPGVNGQNWHPLIKHYHLLVYETRFQRNYKYCHGCPDAFNFGTSETPYLADLGVRVRTLLADPVATPASDPEQRHRTLILVGHDIASDLSYLDHIDVNPGQLPGFLGCADTKDMHQAWRACPDGRNLGAICDDLEILTSNLHNAGNDAAYTLQAMLGLAVRALVDEQQGEDNDSTTAAQKDTRGSDINYAEKFHEGRKERW